MIQHKNEAKTFYRFLSIVYDHIVNPGHWTIDMRTDALEPAKLDDPSLKVCLLLRYNLICTASACLTQCCRRHQHYGQGRAAESSAEGLLLVMQVVDVGGGTGFCTQGIVETIPPQNVTLIDQSPHQLAKAKGKADLQGVTILEARFCPRACS